MPHIGEANGDAVVDLDLLSVAAGPQQGHQSRRIIQVVQRLHRWPAAALVLAVFPFRFGHLDVGTVAQHDIAQRAGGCTGIYRAAKALLIQQRQQARVIHMSVGQQYEIQCLRRHRQRLVDVDVLALLHAIVHKAALVPHFQIGTAACDLMGRAQERDFQ